MIGRPLDFVTAPLLQTATLLERTHRPWPLPRRPWVMGQTWDDLLFAHWPIDDTALGSLVPVPLSLDRFDGAAWLGITPFEIVALRPSITPPLPFASRFPELNVRTYVTHGGKPGIYFFSLDARSDVAVAAARLFYRLPYFRAEMSIRRDGETTDFSSSRVPGEARFSAHYRPGKMLPHAAPGTLEHFLTERYCLYTIDERGRAYRAEIHHPPWNLQEADGELQLDNLLPSGIDPPLEQALLHYSRRQHVLIWRLKRL
jgi:uncharacterized protein